MTVNRIIHPINGRVAKPYAYEEYPKWIVTAWGERKIVHSAEEEERETSPLGGAYDEFVSVASSEKTARKPRK
jgi:hypothetical protein